MRTRVEKRSKDLRMTASVTSEGGSSDETYSNEA
jgi:hypothetical protein